jgi:hypothetical protein
VAGHERKCSTSLRGGIAPLALSALGILGCPQLLQDDFSVYGIGGPDTLRDEQRRSDAGSWLHVPLPDGGVSECVALSFQGRRAVYCGGAGDTFPNAQARCSALGMRPVRIDSAAKNAALLELVPPLYTALATLTEEQPSLWIDAQDGALEGTWRWGSDSIFWLGDATGSAQNGAYVNWSAGKPNNNATGPGEDCALIYIGEGTDGLGQWNDAPCDNLHTSLCEDAAAP